MPRKPTGNPPGRPGKPYRNYPGWIVKVIESTLAGDLTTRQLPTSSQRSAQACIALFNRARTKFVEECREAGRMDEADIAMDLLARVTCDLDGNWCIEFEARGLALEELERVTKRRAAQLQEASTISGAQLQVIDFEQRLEAMARARPEAAQLTEEQEAENRAEAARIRARDQEATELLRQQQQDEATSKEIDEAVAEPPAKA